MLGIGAPKPDRRRAERMRCQPLITKICKLRVGFRHSGVAEFTANKVLIRPVTGGVHGTTDSSLSEPAISLMRVGSHHWRGRSAALDIHEAAGSVADDMQEQRHAEGRKRWLRNSCRHACAG